MKKIVLGVAIAAALGVGGYFALNKGKEAAGNFGEEQMTAFITENKNKAIPIGNLQLHPMIERANITIVESSDNHVKSILTLKPVNQKAAEIPLNSEITRGEFSYADETYGFAKIITKADLTGINDLPPFINEDTLTNTTYIGLNGDMASVTSMAPIKFNEAELLNVDFQGLTAVLDSSVLDSTEGAFKLDFKGLSVLERDEKINIGTFSMNINVDKDGSYNGDSTPLNFSFDDNGEAVTIDLSKGTYEGTVKQVEGLNFAASNGTSKYDKLTVVSDGKPVVLENMLIEGGFYDVGDKKVDLKVKLASDINISSIKSKMGLPIEPQSIELSYGLTNIGFDAVNTYFSSIDMFDNSSDWPFSEEDSKTMLESVQKSGGGFNFGLTMKAAEGNGEAKIDLAFNDIGKTSTPEAIVAAFSSESPQAIMPLFNGTTNLTVSKALVDATGTSMYMMMAGAKEDGDNYVFDAELKDGKATLNGQPIPGM